MEPIAPPALDIANGLFAVAKSLDRLAAAHEHLAHHSARLAGQVPELRDDDARWLFRIAGDVIPKTSSAPHKPEQVDDPRTRVVMLGRNLAERLADYALPEFDRKAKWAKEKVEREQRALREAEGSFHTGTSGAQANGSPF